MLSPTFSYLQRLKDDNFVCNFNRGHIGDTKFIAGSMAKQNGIVPDPDPLLGSNFVDTRQTFLRVCQQFHYQFDSHRQAKFSTTMLVHRLLTPYAASDSAFVCASCRAAVTAATHWLDPMDQGFDVCDASAKTMRDCRGNSELLFADRSCTVRQRPLFSGSRA